MKNFGQLPIIPILKGAERNGIRVSLLPVDRGFSVEVITELQMRKIRFRMPAVKTPGIKRAIEEIIKKKRKAVSKYAMTSSDGKTGIFTLVTIKKKKDEDRKSLKSSDKTKRYMVFAASGKKGIRTSIDATPEAYRERWAIETRYRVAKKASGRTASLNPSARLLLSCMALLNADLRIIVRSVYAKCTGLSHDNITMGNFLGMVVQMIFSLTENAASNLHGS